MTALLATSQGELRSALLGALLVIGLAALVYFGCRAARRPQWGETAAAVIVIVGAVLLLVSLL